MADGTAEFFAELGQRGHEPLLAKGTGTLRFDLIDGKRTERWLVTIKKGDIGISHRHVQADCVVRTDKTLFEAIARGELNAMAAMLRGTMEVDGSPALLVLFQRLFPGPPRSRRRHTAGDARRRK